MTWEESQTFFLLCKIWPQNFPADATLLYKIFIKLCFIYILDNKKTSKKIFLSSWNAFFYHDGKKCPALARKRERDTLKVIAAFFRSFSSFL